MATQIGRKPSVLPLRELTDRVSARLGRKYYPSYVAEIRRGDKASRPVSQAISEIEAEVRRERRTKKLAPQAVETIA